MKNIKIAINQHLSNPRFQTKILVRCTLLCIILIIAILFIFSFEVISWFTPEIPTYFLIDGKNNPIPIIASDKPLPSSPLKVKNENL